MCSWTAEEVPVSTGRSAAAGTAARQRQGRQDEGGPGNAFPQIERRQLMIAAFELEPEVVVNEFLRVAFVTDELHQRE